MNFLRKFLGSSQTEEVASIPSGKLFLTRSPLSPKGAFECLYNDAYASIRQTTSPFYYQLCITRVYQEGEDVAGGNYEDSDEDDGFESSDSAKNSGSLSGHSKDEWTFAIIEDLKLRRYIRPDSTRVIAWKDINGDIDDMFEFVIHEDVKSLEIYTFVLALFKCVYEQKYRTSSHNITSIDQLSEFTDYQVSHASDHGLADLKKHQIDSHSNSELESATQTGERNAETDLLST